MELDAALDRFWEAADAGRLGIDAVEVVAGRGRDGERRRIDDIRRDVFSVSKTVTSLAVGMLEGDGALSLDDPVVAYLPELAGTAAAGSERITVGHCSASGLDLRDFLVPRLFGRSASGIRSGCAAPSASRWEGSASSCGPRKSAGSRNCSSWTAYGNTSCPRWHERAAPRAQFPPEPSTWGLALLTGLAAAGAAQAHRGQR